jgi:putative membrane protein
MQKTKEYIINFFKGFAMGAANVIPGVSGGTIALITGIFERLIDSLKSFNIKALQLLIKGKIKEFAEYTDLIFLITVLLGTGISIISFAKILTFLFINYPIFIWSYFFGLIVASVWFVGRTIDKINFSVIFWFLFGTTVAITITILKPATENSNFWYLLLSGIVAICSMILPGLSGSFVLVLMGEYQLVLRAVDNLNISVLIPVALGSIIGLLAFSHLLSWLYKKYKNQTIALLTGFILGSLAILWPWQHSFDANGKMIASDKFGKLLTNIKPELLTHKRYLPELNSIVLWAIIIAVAGFLTIWLLEKSAGKKESENINVR